MERDQCEARMMKTRRVRRMYILYLCVNILILPTVDSSLRPPVGMTRGEEEGEGEGEREFEREGGMLMPSPPEDEDGAGKRFGRRCMVDMTAEEERGRGSSR
jgi:hypothetical protein